MKTIAILLIAATCNDRYGDWGYVSIVVPTSIAIFAIIGLLIWIVLK